MALEIKLSQKLSQTLLMTPQLQQAIKLLQLGRQEYVDAIQKELLENPILEEMAEEEGNSSQPATKIQFAESQESVNEPVIPTAVEEKPTKEMDAPQWEDIVANFSDYYGSNSPKGLVDYEERPSVEATLSKSEGLVEHLLAQLQYEELSKEDREIVLYIVGNLNKDGYLCATTEEICEACHCCSDEVERILRIVHNLDPVGIAARDLGECLFIQLDTMGFGEHLAARMVRNHLDKVEARKFEQIARAENTLLEDVYSAMQLIQSLDPRPGSIFSDEVTRYIVPDIYVYKDGNDYVISLNEDGLPKLKVSTYYLSLLQRKDDESSPGRNYLTDRLKAASWLIRSIHQRQQTIYKVTESIMKFQREFLEQGIEKLRPLVLKDVADDIGMHESTVSRVTTNKYVHTPQGVFELKFFFTTGIKSGDGSLSSSSIKEKIRTIITSEDHNAPISDQEIVDILKKENIDIARRTVAKYREGMGILSSSKRKKLF